MLVLSTLLCVLQYISLYSSKSSLVDLINSYLSFNSLHAQTLYLNIYSNRIDLNSTSSSDINLFISEVNTLNNLVNVIPLTVEADISYRNGPS